MPRIAWTWWPRRTSPKRSPADTDMAGLLDAFRNPTLPPFRPDPGEGRHRVRRILAGLGLDEVVTHALIGPADLARGGLDPSSPSLVRLANPLAEQHSIPAAGHVPVAARRPGGEREAATRLDPWLFEVGKIYWTGGSAEADAGSRRDRAFRAWQLGVALLGPDPAIGRRPADRSRCRRAQGGDRGTARLVGCSRAGLSPYRRGSRPSPAPRSTTDVVDSRGHRYGSLGELDPRVASAWDLPGRPVAATLSLPALFNLVAPGGAGRRTASRSADRSRPGCTAR